MGVKFHDINIIRDHTRQELIKALAFQKSFMTIVCEVLEMQFKDNHIMDAFKILEPTNAHVACWIGTFESRKVGNHLCLLWSIAWII